MPTSLSGLNRTHSRWRPRHPKRHRMRRPLCAVTPVRPPEEPTCAATTRAFASHRAVRLWWNRRRYVRRPWSDWSGYVEMPRSPRSAAQPPVTQTNQDRQNRPKSEPHFSSLASSAHPRPGGYSEHPMDGTLSTHTEYGRESPASCSARSAHLAQHRAPWRLAAYPR